ncbi:hypothetical protein KO500_10915 [Cellulophaga baltica]|uniref:hypothetical protein n=1 Tax=Cellulophaga TaxID=104264 RepID=UPI001C066359|nr:MULTISPECIES: hypothetical protein [Cellulophaga]MBU2996950.1 hypothetical protein [Cellulophaga baltica]MDO6768348.1 hypothetical protein [Cellulophaga sp. 1_MG-2023]
MKNFNLSIYVLFFTFCLSGYSQSANLNREPFKVAYVKLPSKPVLDDAKRTYSSNSRAVRISGFTKVATNGTIDFNLDFHGTTVGDIDIKKETEEEKDKDGNVTSTKHFYYAVTTFSTTATLTISNMDSGENLSYPYSEKTGYTGSKYRSYNEASKSYNRNRYSIRDKHRAEHRSSIESTVSYRVNSIYGYEPYESLTGNIFWILATKKHPEYQKHQETYEALKTIFDEMEYDQTVEPLLENVQPYVDYFNDVVARYDKDDRKSKKLRYASFYNIAMIYLKLDQPLKAKEYANKLIDNDYDKGDGKRINNSADKLIALFETNKTDSRHFEVITEDVSNEPVVTEVLVEAEEEDTSEKSIAFLITAQNDTLQTTVSANELAKMSVVVNVLGTGNEHEVYEAQNAKKMVVANGDTYEVVDFKSALANDATSVPKFAKVLIEGEKINLYAHQGSEFVLQLKDRETTTSTMSKNFVFGFNKELSVFAEDCLALKAKVNTGEFKNKKEDLIKFAQELNSCN